MSHPLLLAWGRQSWLLLSFDTPWQVNLGKATLLLLFLGVLFALLFLKLGVDYNLWRTAHKGMFAVVVLAFLHGMYIGPDIQSGSVRIYWISMFSVVCAVFLYRNLIVPVTWVVVLIAAAVAAAIAAFAVIRSGGHMDEHPGHSHQEHEMR